MRTTCALPGGRVLQRRAARRRLARRRAQWPRAQRRAGGSHGGALGPDVEHLIDLGIFTVAGRS